MQVHGIQILIQKWTNDVWTWRNDTRIQISENWEISTIAGSNLFGCKSFVIRETALFDIRDNVGKFRERVSNRFGTEDDDRSSLSPVSLATCKPNCVTWSETETERSWAREGKERKEGAIHQIRRPSAVERRCTTFQRSDVRLPFLKSSPGIRLHRCGYRAPCYVIGPRRA